MAKAPERISASKRGFLFEKDAATPRKVRVRKAAIYAGLVWVVMLLGIFLLKYVFDVIDRPISTLLIQIPILPLLLFVIISYGYYRADLTSKPNRRLNQKDD
jgi:hypothetical protein